MTVYLVIGLLLSIGYAAYKLHDGGLKPGDFVHAPVETGFVFLIVVFLWPFVLVGLWLERRP